MNRTIQRQLTVAIENQPGRAGRFLVLLHEAEIADREYNDLPAGRLAT